MNEITSPANTPVYFKVTSNSTMNSLFIPYLGSQICAMAGMQTRLHLITNEPSAYDGTSASYSDPNFSGTKFKAIATPNRAGFNQQVAKTRQSPSSMSDMAAFKKLAAPSEYNQVEYFSSAKPGLLADVTNKFMTHGKSIDMTQPEGEHSAYGGMRGVNMSRAELAH